MDNKGLISVIIPVYNVEKYLEECIKSVLSQTYENFEIILVDDGSTDKSGEICDRYAKKDNRIKVIHKGNGGLSSARNCGFAESTGEYIYFLDSDDWIVEETLADLLGNAETNNADLVFFDAISVEESTGEILKKQSYVRKKHYNTSKGYEILGQLQNNKEYHSPVQMLLLKRNFVVKNSLSFIPGILYEDMVYTFEAFSLAEKVSYLNKALYMKRVRAGSITHSHKTKRNYISCHKVYSEVLAFKEVQNLNDDIVNKYISRIAFNGLNSYRELSCREKQECRKDYRQFKKSIKLNGNFGDTALKMRCHGYLFWFIYKVFEKTIGHVLK